MVERLVVTDQPTQCRRRESANSIRPMGMEDSLHRDVMENSRQPRKAEKHASPTETDEKLERSSAANAAEFQHGSSPEIRDADLGTLGTATIEEFIPIQGVKRSIRRLRPSELTRLLNSTPLGTVISERQLYRHRERAGHRIGEQRWIDLVRYAAWLAAERHQTAYERLKTQRSTSSRHRITKQEVIDLLESQAYRCALTGWELTPHTASLDHQIPVSRGGEHCIQNAQALHEDVNRAKGSLTNEEFVVLCRAVVCHDDSASPQSEKEPK